MEFLLTVVKLQRNVTTGNAVTRCMACQYAPIDHPSGVPHVIRKV